MRGAVMHVEATHARTDSRVPRCPSQAEVLACRAKSTRSRHFEPLVASSELFCVVKPQVTALRILAYSPKRKASAYFAHFLFASPSCRQSICSPMPASSPGRAFLPMCLLLIPEQTRCRGVARWRRHQLACSCTLHQPTRASNARPYVHLRSRLSYQDSLINALLPVRPYMLLDAYMPECSPLRAPANLNQSAVSCILRFVKPLKQRLIGFKTLRESDGRITT